MAPDAVRSDLDFTVPAGTLLIMALDTKVQDWIIQLVRIGPGVGIVTGITAFLHGRMDIGSRWFVVVAFLTGDCWFGGRNMGVVTLLALIFLESGMFIGLIGYIFMTGLALSYRDCSQETG